MAIKSKTFSIRKGENIDSITSFLQSTIGKDCYLVKDISAVSINDTVTQITIIYQDYPDFAIDSVVPREGLIIPTGVLGNRFDTRILFNSRIDTNTVVSGTFIADDNLLPTSRVFIDPSGNNYFTKINLSGSQYQSTGYHELRIDSTNLCRHDSSKFDYSPVVGYIINSLSSPHLGDKLSPYVDRRRGLIKADVIRASKGNNPQQLIEEYLNQISISKENLIAYSSVSRNDNNVEVYFIYINKLEPQIVEGFPLNNALIPNTASFDNLTLVFSTKLDGTILSTATGIFTLESDFSTSTRIDPQYVSLLTDQKTVKINLSSYISSDKLYSLVVRTGLRSLDGVYKDKPEQWGLYIADYQSSAISFTGDLTVTGVAGAPTGARYILWDLHPSLPSGRLIQGGTGIRVTTDPVVQIGLSGDFYNSTTGHWVDYNNPHQVTTSQIGAVPVADFTGHTGQTNIHYTQAQISIPSTQISDFTEAAQDAIGSTLVFGSGVTGNYNDASNQINISGIYATNTRHGIAYFPSTQFAVSNGQVLVNTNIFNVADLLDVDDDLDYISGYALVYNSTAGAFLTYPVINSISVTGATLLQDVVFSGAGTVVLIKQGTNTLIISGQTGVGGAGGASSSEPFVVYSSAPALTSSRVLIGGTGIQISNTASNVIVALSGDLYTGITGHIGNTGIHFTQSQISIPSTQVSNFSEAVDDRVGSLLSGISNVHTIYVDGSDILYISGSGPSMAQFTGHTGDTNIHHTQAEIDISILTYLMPVAEALTGHTGSTGLHFNESQIIEISQDAFNSMIRFGSGMTGTYNDSSNTYTLSGIYATTSRHGIAYYSPSYFSVSSNGMVSILPDSISIEDLLEVGSTLSYTDNFALVYSSSDGKIILEPIVNSISGAGTNVARQGIVVLSGIGNVTVHSGSDNSILISGSSVGGANNLNDLTDVQAIASAYNFIGYNPSEGLWSHYRLSGAGDVVVSKNDAAYLLIISGNNPTSVLTNKGDLLVLSGTDNPVRLGTGNQHSALFSSTGAPYGVQYRPCTWRLTGLFNITGVVSGAAANAIGIIYSGVIPAGTLSANSALEFNAWGWILNNGGASAQLTPRLYWNGTQVWADAGTLAASSVQRVWKLNTIIQCVNSTGSQSIHGHIVMQNTAAAGSVAGLGNFAATETHNLISHLTGTVLNANINGAIPLVFDVQFASGSNQFWMNYAGVTIDVIGNP